MRWIIRAIVLFALLIGGFGLAERLIIYAFDPRRIDPPVAGISEVIVTSATGKKMYVWVAAPRQGKPTLLYLHGNAGNLNNRSPRFRGITERGYGLIAPAYRGSSGSTGWPIESLIREDIAGFYAQLVQGEITGAPVRPIIYGESIGAAVAIHLNAAITQAGLDGPRAIVLEAPFTSLRDLAHSIQPELVLATGFMTSHWRSIEYADKLTAPLLILHGRNDRLVPISQGRAIFDAASSRNKDFYEVTNAGHVDVWKVATQKRLYRFLSGF